jgi:hypothetical protein
MRAAGSTLPAAPARERKVLPAAAVLFVLALVVLGGYGVAGALSSPAGPPVEVAGTARVTPLSGWELAERFDDPPGARLTRGGANLDVFVFSFGGTRDELLRAYVTEVLDPDAEQLSFSQVETVELASGLGGSRLFYVGTSGDVQAPIEGAVTAVVPAPGVGLVFDGWTSFGLLQYALDDLETMIERAEVA